MTEPTVVVRGEARRSGPPELVTVTLSVRAGGRVADEVTRTLSERAAQLQAVIERSAAGIERSSTSGLRVGPTVGRAHADRPKGYQGRFSATVVLHDFGLLSEVVTSALAVEQGQVEGPEWSLRPDSRLYREARLAAVDDARTRAEDYAAAFGARITGLLEISDTDPGGRGVSRLAWMSSPAGAAAEPDFELEPAEQEVTGQLIVRFSLSEPDPAAVSER